MYVGMVSSGNSAASGGASNHGSRSNVSQTCSGINHGAILANYTKSSSHLDKQHGKFMVSKECVALLINFVLCLNFSKDARKARGEQYARICFSHTPEGGQCGLTWHLSHGKDSCE
jgi:hypothetical protein